MAVREKDWTINFMAMTKFQNGKESLRILAMIMNAMNVMVVLD